jgi:hypothetical protein
MFPAAADDGSPKRQRFVTCERQNAVVKNFKCCSRGISIRFIEKVINFCYNKKEFFKDRRRH